MSFPTDPWALAMDAIHNTFMDQNGSSDAAVEMVHVLCGAVGLHLSGEWISEDEAVAEFLRYLRDPFTDERPITKFAGGMIMGWEPV